MIIECNRCYTRYRYDEGRFLGRPTKKVRCTKCLSVFEVDNPASAPSAASTEARADETFTRLSPEAGERKPADSTRKMQTRSAGKPSAASDLALPADAKLSLAVISGTAAGTMFVIEKPRIVIGREECDLRLDDPEVSRNHAAIEVSGDRVTLVDLESTNGTFLGEEAVREAVLENQDEFAIGGSTLMLIVTQKV